MTQSCSNIYLPPRLAAGYTQERAAELLDISVRSLAAYETGERIPPEDVVLRMIEVYGTPYLAYQYLRTSMEIARNIMPEIEEVDLSKAVIRLLNRIRSFADKHCTDRLLEIADDGVIDEIERAEFEKILGELDEIVKAAMVFKFIREGD